MKSYIVLKILKMCITKFETYYVLCICSGEKDAEFRQKLIELKKTRKKEFLMLVKNMADITMCINWLPLGGFLWSGKLSPARTAFFGTVSSLIALYMSIKQYHATKSKKE